MIALRPTHASNAPHSLPLPPRRCARQRDSYLDLVRDLPYARVIDASQPLESVVRDVEDVIVGFLQSRAADRFNLRDKR